MSQPDAPPPAAPGEEQEKEALGYMLVNLSGVPGLGSWLSGKRVLGSLQIALSLTGELLSILGLIGVASYYFTHGSEQAFATPGLLTALAGLGLFLLSLAWSLVTGYLHWQRLKRANRQMTEL